MHDIPNNVIIPESIWLLHVYATSELDVEDSPCRNGSIMHFQHVETNGGTEITTFDR